MNFKYIGKSLQIKDGVSKVTGQAQYVDDLFFPNMLYGKLLFSPVAHARIKKIDTSQCEALPGVEAVATFLNSPSALYNSSQRFIDHEIPETERIFDSTVRFVGDRVAAVAAIDQATAEKAVLLIHK